MYGLKVNYDEEETRPAICLDLGEDLEILDLIEYACGSARIRSPHNWFTYCRLVGIILGEGPMAKEKCPHCGNSDPELIEDNGVSSRSVRYSLLCVARIKPEDWAFSSCSEPEVGPDGLVTCGVTWSPNDQ